MSRLRNRIVKAEYYNDPDLLQWPRQKRELYRSLWAMAEDSYCIENSPFGWKVTAWPSPLDTDMNIESFEIWRDELIEAGKLIPYESGGKRYLFLPDMARHEKPRNPQSPSIPLPPFVTWLHHTSDTRKGTYEVSWDVVQRLYNGSTTLPALPSPALPSPVQATEEDGPSNEFYTLFRIWERTIGSVPSEATKRTIRSWATMGYSEPAVEAALKTALENGAGAPARYATAILRSGPKTDKTAQEAELDEKWSDL